MSGRQCGRQMSKFERLLNFHAGARFVSRDAAGEQGPSHASSVGHFRFNRTAVIYACVLTSIIFALIPALFFSYGYHNDFNAWGYDSHTCCDQHPETRVLLAVGRYFASIAENLQFFTIHTVDDLWLWRLIGILSTAALAAYYLHIVSLGRPPTWLNACLAVALFTLPTMQFQAIWPSMYTMWTPPILLSLLAAQAFAQGRRGRFFCESICPATSRAFHAASFCGVAGGPVLLPNIRNLCSRPRRTSADERHPVPATKPANGSAHYRSSR